MGYNFIIGNAKLLYNSELVRIDAEGVYDENAPAFGEPTDYTNERWPSYIGWANFCNTLDLYGIFHDYETEYKNEYLHGLIVNHPGAEPITPLHVEYVEEKINRYKEKYPDHIAQFPPTKEGIEDTWHDSDFVDDPKYDANLCRAEWLIYWMKWAVENCDMPVFVNS